MSIKIATVAQNLEKGYVKMMQFETEHILYVSGKASKVRDALLHGSDSAEKLKAAAQGGKTIFLPLEEITRFRTRSDRNTIDVGFKDAKGRSCTIDIEVREAEKKAIVQKMGIVLKGKGHSKTEEQASFFALAWLPILIMIGTVVIGGAVTLSQNIGGLDPNDIEGHGGGRAGRRGRGFAVLLAVVANLLGFWGCLALTLAILAVCFLYLLRKLINRPIVTCFRPQQSG